MRFPCTLGAFSSFDVVGARLSRGRKKPPEVLDGSACVVASVDCSPGGLNEENAPDTAAGCEAGLTCKPTPTSLRTD